MSEWLAGAASVRDYIFKRVQDYSGRLWSRRRNDFQDPAYGRSPWGRHALGKEVASLVAGSVVVTPMLPVAPFFVGALYYCAWNYYRVHRKSHLDPEWAKRHLPWHYDHHMGPNPNAKWCVTRPWLDHLMGTREYFLTR